jgi:hypothetical protein
MKRIFSTMTLKDVMRLIPSGEFTRWYINAPLRPPGSFLQEALRRFEVFDVENSEAAKILLIDALLAEIVPDHAGLKVWKSMALESDTLSGIADYLIAPRRAYVALPLLCAAEAKRDDFIQGRAQCIAEMIACRDNNRQEGHEIDVYGIVSNGQTWQFYKLTPQQELFETDLYVTSDLPRLLGALDYVCGECAKNNPSAP